MDRSRTPPPRSGFASTPCPHGLPPFPPVPPPPPRGPSLPILQPSPRPLHYGHWPPAPAHSNTMPLHPTLGSMPGLAKTIFPSQSFPSTSGSYGSHNKSSVPEPLSSAPNSGYSPNPPAPCTSAAPNNATPHPPNTLPVPEDWLQDHEYLDTRRSIGNLSCPRFVVSSSWAREKGIAGTPVTSLHPAHFLYQGWNSYWLRWIAACKEAYFIVARTKAEMVLAGELLPQIRAQGLDIDAAATNLAVKALGQFLVDQVKSKIPVETDYESHARIRELEGQIGSLQQQLKQQQQSASVPSANNIGLGAPGPSTPPPPRGSNADRSPLATPVESSSPGSSAKPNNAAVLAGQNLRQLPLQFSPGSNLGNPAKPEPSSIMQPPQEGSPWLASHFPAKCHDKEFKAWINSLTLNDRKKSELLEWLKQVEDWVESQDIDDFLTKIRRTAVIWGVPPATVTKLQKQPLAKLIAVGSYMER